MTKSDLHNKWQPDGYIHDLVTLLQEQMKFNYEYKVVPIEVSYDELVDCVQNRTYEIVMADLSMTSTRTEKIDFSYPIYDNVMRLVIRKSQRTTISPFAFFKPFSVLLWVSIAFIIYLFSAVLIALYESYGQEGEQNGAIRDVSKIITICRSLFHTIGALLQRGSELQPQTFFGRLQTVVIWLMSIILVALLTSNLTSYFNAQREKAWLESIEDLHMCRKVDCNRIGIVERSHHEEYFTKEVLNGNQMNYYHLKHPNESYRKLLEYYIDVAIADSSSADYFTQTPDYCQLEVTGIPFGKTYFGIALPKQWRYKQDLDNHIMQLKLDGEIDRLLKKWFQQKNCDSKSRDENNHLTVIEVSGLFYIFIGLTTVNLVAFISYSWYVKKYSRNIPASSTTEGVDDVGETESVGGQNQEPQSPAGDIEMLPLRRNSAPIHTPSDTNDQSMWF